MPSSQRIPEASSSRSSSPTNRASRAARTPLRQDIRPIYEYRPPLPGTMLALDITGEDVEDPAWSGPMAMPTVWASPPRAVSTLAPLAGRRFRPDDAVGLRDWTAAPAMSTRAMCCNR